MTSMFGSDSDGPARSKARAEPFPMPEASNPCIIGTSVRVAKYMNAPVKLAKKFDNNELPPTAHSIQLFGTMPAIAVLSCVEPSMKPAVTTPIASNGIICLAKPHEANAHSLFSSSRLSNCGRGLRRPYRLGPSLARPPHARTGPGRLCRRILLRLLPDYDLRASDLRLCQNITILNYVYL